MSISRRSLLRRISVGAAITASVSSVGGTLLGSIAPTPWLSGEPESAGPVRLDRNENHYGPSAKAIAAMRDAANIAYQYPDIESAALQNKIASLHRIPAEQVVLGCGSRDILRMAIDAFVRGRKKLLLAQPTFEFASDYARAAGAELEIVPLRKDYAHDLGAMLARVDESVGLVYICNPNNPTASVTPREEIEEFIKKLPRTAYVLIDEAYHQYVVTSSNYSSFIDDPVDDNRVIVARSFSKVYGLAGMRVGYAVTAKPAANILNSYKLPDGLSLAGAMSAFAALDDNEHVQESVRRNANDRQEFFNHANTWMLPGIDSHTNFVMFNAGMPGTQVVEYFKRNNVLVSGPFPPFDKHIRVSLGTPSEMARFWQVWDTIPNKMKM